MQSFELTQDPMVLVLTVSYYVLCWHTWYIKEGRDKFLKSVLHTWEYITISRLINIWEYLTSPSSLKVIWKVITFQMRSGECSNRVWFWLFYMKRWLGSSFIILLLLFFFGLNFVPKRTIQNSWNKTNKQTKNNLKHWTSSQ